MSHGGANLGEPDPDEFVPGATYPSADAEEAVSRIRYPEEARKNGIEGKVHVGVLVDRTGRPVKSRIEMSDNPIFNDAAVSAVMGTRFTPGVLNGVPIDMWVVIPIVFKLNK